mmetsp:Transcript_18636/g.30635  ORF Transcript_18636/g.30635 Transcript_18636/m.30635 type:complete len:230 (+) Transcript_18636:6202-6891(+)
MDYSRISVPIQWQPFRLHQSLLSLRSGLGAHSNAPSQCDTDRDPNHSPVFNTGPVPDPLARHHLLQLATGHGRQLHTVPGVQVHLFHDAGGGEHRLVPLLSRHYELYGHRWRVHLRQCYCARQHHRPLHHQPGHRVQLCTDQWPFSIGFPGLCLLGHHPHTHTQVGCAPCALECILQHCPCIASCSVVCCVRALSRFLFFPRLQLIEALHFRVGSIEVMVFFISPEETR